MSALLLIASHFHHVETLRQKKNFVFSLLPTNKKSGNENLKKFFANCNIDTGSKVLRHFESKSSGANNFIGFFALKLCNNSHGLIMKMTQHVTSQTKRKT